MPTDRTMPTSANATNATPSAGLQRDLLIRVQQKRLPIERKTAWLLADTHGTRRCRTWRTRPNHVDRPLRFFRPDEDRMKPPSGLAQTSRDAEVINAGTGTACQSARFLRVAWSTTPQK